MDIEVASFRCLEYHMSPEALSMPQVSLLSLRHRLMAKSPLSSELVRAARALLRWEQKELAEASGVSLPTVKRLEASPGLLSAHGPTVAALQRAFEDAGLEFIPENGGGAGIRFRNRADGTREEH
ncbi:hypothetical protein FHR71_003678 [Methylobacterium sp. RAS18]|nr:hypothetical protein [Methylobacterium sp. RAS18]